MLHPHRLNSTHLWTAALALGLSACGVGTVDNATLTTSGSGASVSSQTGGQGQGATTTPNPVTNPNTNKPTPATSPSPTASPNTPATPATPAAPGTFTGTVDGVSFSPKSAIFAVVTQSDGSQTLAVKLSDQADDCTEVTHNAHRANSNSFWLRAVGTTFANDAFELKGQSTDSGNSTATFYALDSSCASTLSNNAAWATSGQLTFTSVSAQAATGTFKASMGTQKDSVSGSFAATVCPALGTLITAPNTTRTCE